MRYSNVLVSLDIGTSRIRVIIGEVKNGAIHIIGVGTSVSEGLKKGAIVDIDQTVQAIRAAVQQAERMTEVPIREVFVGISGEHVQLVPTEGVVAVSSEDREIRDEDVIRVVQAAKVVAIPPEREIVDVVPREFIVDGLRGVSDPRGMIGVRLEMEGYLITGAKTVIHNLLRCVERAGLSLAGLFLEPLAVAEIALTKDDRQLGVALVDVGAGETQVSLFQHGDLVKMGTVPLGGDHVTNDIAYGLRTTTEEAERVKLKHGCALIDEASETETFRVASIGSDHEVEYNQVYLAEIIEPRMEEIFLHVRKKVLEMAGKDPAGGYVLTGGSMAMPGVLRLARETLGAAVRVAIPDYIGVRDPAYTTGVGLIQFAAKQMARLGAYEAAATKPKKRPAKASSGVFERVKNWLSEFI
ncbi:cell division protein FtsA [Calditerricola satsumensis]|uniref:Cell division protein FtsA n=1 Tax=Calditerricola satsumensis TaxID=373054 RepID=A0A8J3F865_9BACI|nr:cell division protein FtsA [Calditerricola satsumensis]GGJ92310.1 cell division protein FtsA [Calditerricola satsumensis]